MSAAKKPLLALRDLTVKFGTGSDLFTAVHKMNIDVFPNEIVGLIGESGSGKTTCVHSVMGLVDGQPGVCEGKAQFEGRDILPDSSKTVKILEDGKVKKKHSVYKSQHLRRVKPVLGRGIASIFQEPKSALNPYFSIGQHIMECMTRGRVQVPDKTKYGHELLSQVGIVDGDKVWEQYPHHLSGGMAQRVMIAMALSCHPKLLIADEPTTALDVTTQAKLLQLFLKFRESMGLSLLMISHDIGVIREVSDRVYVMYKGNIVESGVTKDVIENPRHDYTRMLLGAFDKLAVKD